MYCPQCGKENKDEAKFCSSCGAPLKRSAKQAEPDSVEAKGAANTVDRKPPAKTTVNQAVANVQTAESSGSKSQDAGANIGAKIAAMPTKQKSIIGGVAAVVVIVIIALIVIVNGGPSDGTIESIVRENVSTKDMSSSSTWSDDSAYSVKSVKVLEKHKEDTQGTSSYEFMGVKITDPYTAKVEVVFSNDDSEITKQGDINLVKANGKWDTIYFSGSNLKTTAAKVTKGVDKKKVVKNMSTILYKADGDSYTSKLSSIYDEGDFKVKKSYLDTDKSTDTVTISCASNAKYCESKGSVTAKFVFGESGWELKSAKASDGLDKVSFQKLVGTWTGEFKEQSGSEECFGGKANPLTVKITSVDDKTGKVEGTFSGVAHNHKEPDNAEDSDAGDTVLTDVPFNMVFDFDGNGSYLRDDYECPEDSNGQVTFELELSDDAEATLRTSYRPDSILNWSSYADTYTLTKSK